MGTDDPTCSRQEGDTGSFLLLRACPDPASMGEENGVSITSLPKKEVSPFSLAPLEHGTTRSKALAHAKSWMSCGWADLGSPHPILKVGKGEFDPSIPVKKEEITRQLLD